MKSLLLASLFIFSAASFASECVSNDGPVLIREVREIPR